MPRMRGARHLTSFPAPARVPCLPCAAPPVSQKEFCVVCKQHDGVLVPCDACGALSHLRCQAPLSSPVAVHAGLGCSQCSPVRHTCACMWGCWRGCAPVMTLGCTL